VIAMPGLDVLYILSRSVLFENGLAAFPLTKLPGGSFKSSTTFFTASLGERQVLDIQLEPDPDDHN